MAAGNLRSRCPGKQAARKHRPHIHKRERNFTCGKKLSLLNGKLEKIEKAIDKVRENGYITRTSGNGLDFKLV